MLRAIQLNQKAWLFNEADRTLKKSKRTLIDGEIYHVHGLEESI